jgi:primary-amine oxidase
MVWSHATDRDQQDQAGADGHGPARHPLDPLDAGEIARAVQILRRQRPVPADARFVSVTLHEPPKDQAGFPAAESQGLTPVAREAAIVLRDPRQHATREAVVSLTEGSVRSWRTVPGAQAPLTATECRQCEAVTRTDPRIRAGLEQRGITDPGLVRVEAWGIGIFSAPEEAGRRLAWTLLFYREQPDGNPYAKPIHGLHAVVDLDDMTVLRVEDLGAIPLPPGSGAYGAGAGRSAAAGDQPARGPELRGARLGGPLAALAAPAGLHRA